MHTLSIGTRPPSEPYSEVLHDEVTLWVECGPRYTLDRNEGLSWALFQVPSDGVTLLGSSFLQLDRG